MTEPALRTGSHDLPPSAAFQPLMATDWAASPPPTTARVPAARSPPPAAPGSPRASPAND